MSLLPVFDEGGCSSHSCFDLFSEGVDQFTQFTTMRTVNGEAAQVISDLEGRIKGLDQENLGLERQQVMLEKEVKSLKKRKRRDSPSPPPLQPAPKLRILCRGESISPTSMESSLSPSSLPPPKKSRNRQKRWDQPPAPKQGGKVPSPERTTT